MPQSPCSIPVSYGPFYVVSMDWYHLWNQSGSVARNAGRTELITHDTPRGSGVVARGASGTELIARDTPRGSGAVAHGTGGIEVVTRDAPRGRSCLRRSKRRTLPRPLPSHAAEGAATVTRDAGGTAPASSAYCLLAGTCGRFFSTCSSHRRRYLRARCLSPALAYWCDSSI